MWICTSNAFVSIVHKDCAPGELLVRARVKGHIEKLFPEAKVTLYTKSDYLYRAIVSRGTVEAVVAAQIAAIDYGNFKDTVKDDALHNAYLRVWQDMAALQKPPPYSGAR
jgi:hypothetical protein